jgi:hypothetical protein
MPRIEPVEYGKTSGELRETFEQEVNRFGRLTNMKKTLLHSIPSYKILMEWYTLFDIVKQFLGERLTVIFSHAISSESDCLICTTFMRRILIDWGENPDELKLDEKGEAIIAFGRAISKQGNRVPEEVYKKIEGFFTAEQIVTLTAFAGMMVATNIINNALEVKLDEYLYDYCKGVSFKK